MSFHSSHTRSKPAGSCSRRVRLQSTSDALKVALENFIAIEVKYSFGNKCSSRGKVRDVSLRRCRRDCCSDFIFWSLVQFSLSLKVKLFVSILRLACLLPQFVSAPCDLHLLGICHCDLLRTELGTTKNMGVSQVGAQPERSQRNLRLALETKDILFDSCQSRYQRRKFSAPHTETLSSCLIR